MKDSWKYGCNRPRWSERRSERARHLVREQWSGRVCRSPSPRHFSLIASYVSKDKPFPKAHAGAEPVCLHQRTTSRKCTAGAVQSGHRALEIYGLPEETRRRSRGGNSKETSRKENETPYIKVQMKQLTIPANVTPQVFENVFNNAFPDLVVIGLLNEENFGGNYNRNPFDFQAFELNCINVYRSGTDCPRKGYTPEFGNRRIVEAYKTLTKELGYDIKDKALSLTQTEWANGFTLYAFKVNDGLIGSGADSPRSPIPTGDLKISIGISAPYNHNIKVVVLSQSVWYMFFDQFKIVTLV